MLNAKALTLCCVTASVAIFAKVLTPGLAQLEAAQLAHGRSTMDYDRALRELDQILPLPLKALPSRDLTLASMALLSRWAHSSKDYGVTLNDLQAQGDPNNGQSLQSIRSFQTSVGPTGMLTVRIRGTYQSLEEWIEFVKEQMIYQYVSVSQLKLQGQTFEMVLEIFGERKP